MLEDLLSSPPALLFPSPLSLLSALRFLLAAGARPRLERPESWLDFLTRDFCGSEFFILRKSSLKLVVNMIERNTCELSRELRGGKLIPVYKR